MQSTEKFKLKFKGGQTHSRTDCCILRTARGHRVRVFFGTRAFLNLRT